MTREDDDAARVREAWRRSMARLQELTQPAAEVQVDVALARHAAGRAVMRWLEGMPAIDVRPDARGGPCARPRQRVRVESALWITVAGFAAEVEYDRTRPPEFTGEPFALARRLLARTRPAVAADAVLLDYFDRACDRLRPYADLVETLVRRLVQCPYLKAGAVAYRCSVERRRRQVASRVDSASQS